MRDREVGRQPSLPKKADSAVLCVITMIRRYLSCNFIMVISSIDDAERSLLSRLDHHPMKRPAPKDRIPIAHCID